MKNQNLKIFLGTIIFLFGTALAYFTAGYVSTNHLFDYWGTIAIFGGAYVLIGMVVSSIFAISLGFLFGADVLILHLLLQYYGDWADFVKLAVIGVILAILYVTAAIMMNDLPEASATPAAAPSVPPSGAPPA